MNRYLLILLALPLLTLAQTKRYVVQVDDDGNTIPPNSIATPQQVTTLSTTANKVYNAVDPLNDRIVECENIVQKLSTNLLVTSTVYVQSVGGVPYDPEKQTIKIYSVTKTKTTITIKATMDQIPLIPPALDFRMTLYASNDWDFVASTVTKIAVPAGSDAADAYQFDLAIPNPASAFFRVVDNSTGSSGSGLYWLVYGGVYVDGKKGFTGTINGHKIVGGIVVESEPLGGL